MSKTEGIGADVVAKKVAEEMYKIDNAARALGITIHDPGPGTGHARMLVRTDMLNVHGTCHAGILFSLAVTAFAYACNSANKANVGINCTINYVNPGREGEMLSAIATERMKERRNGIYDVTVTGPDDRIIAIFQGNSREIRGESVHGLMQRMENGEIDQ